MYSYALVHVRNHSISKIFLCMSIDGDWQESGRFTGADQVAVPPFEAVMIDLDGL